MSTEPRHPLVIALIKARHDAGLTQRDVARRLGLSLGAVGNFETGIRRPHLDTAAAWADAVGLRLTLTVPRKGIAA